MDERNLERIIEEWIVSRPPGGAKRESLSKKCAKRRLIPFKRFVIFALLYLVNYYVEINSTECANACGGNGLKSMLRP